MKDSFFYYRNSLLSMPIKYRNNSSLSSFYFYSEMLNRVKKDIKTRFDIEWEDSESVIAFLSSNTGRILSLDDISFKTKVSLENVSSIIMLLEDANIIACITGYDEKSDEFSSNGIKYYFTDNFHIKALRTRCSEHMEREGIVAIELLRRYGKVYYGIESDFIVFDDEEKKIFDILSDEDEIEARVEAMKTVDCLDRYLIVEDVQNNVDESVKILNMKTFLLKWR